MGRQNRRVVHVSTAHAAGDNRILYKECQSLAAAGYDVHYVGPGASSVTDLPAVAMHDLPASRGRLRRMAVGPVGAVGLVRSLRPAVVHLHDPELLPWVPLFRHNGARVVYDAHEHLPSQVMGKPYLHRHVRRPVSVLARGLERWADATCDAVVCATPAIVRAHPRARTVLVQNYPRVDHSAGGSSLPITQRERVVAYVGGITEGRGVRHLVEAMEIAGSSAGIRLLMAGRFSPPGLQAELEELPGWRFVNFVGQVSVHEVPDLLGRARAGIVTLLPGPNYMESYPTKMFEYMAAGLPVIASDFPLWRSIVESVGCGHLVDPTSKDEVADAIIRVCDDPTAAEVSGARGAQAVATDLNWSQQADRLLTTYRALTRA